jgi:hypothetical protein
VCSIRPQCCNGPWDELCVTFAEAFCDFDCDLNAWAVDRIAEVVDHLKTLVITGLTITVGDPTFNDTVGGFNVVNSDVVLDDCRMIGATGFRRSAFHLESGSLEIRDTTFEAFSTTVIECFNATVTVTRSSFESSDTAIIGEEITLHIMNSVFTRHESNFLAYEGNGIACEDSNVTVVDSDFIGLSGTGGGAVSLNRCTIATFERCRFVQNTGIYAGGAITSWFSPLLLINCEFIDNKALPDYHSTWSRADGGAVAAYGTIGGGIRDCTFRGNSAHFGGALSLAYCVTAVDRCHFEGNFTDPDEYFNSGGAVYIDAPESIIRQCTFRENTAAIGGAMHLRAGYVTDCRFLNNAALGLAGGAVFMMDGATGTIANCEFNSNHARYDDDPMHELPIGGAICVDGSSFLTSVNCTFVNNHADLDGGAIAGYTFTPGNSGNTGFTLHNCILWNNTDSTGTGEDAQIYIEPAQADDVLIANSTIEGWTGALGGFGNIGADPMFIDIDGPDNIPGNEDDDLRLAAGSPSIDAGNNNALPIDTFDVDDDGNTAELYPLDLAGNARVMNDPDTQDTGCGMPAVVDMGAYEFVGTKPTVKLLPGDIDGDGGTGVGDLLQLLNEWADVCTDQCCPADINADGVVDVFDLLELLSLWTP